MKRSCGQFLWTPKCHFSTTGTSKGSPADSNCTEESLPGRYKGLEESREKMLLLSKAPLTVYVFSY